jgi:hypothetical protein
MNPETGIYEMLRDNTQLNNLVAGRAYPSIAPQNAVAPYVLIQQVEESEQQTQDGPISDGWTFNVASIAADNATVRAVSRAVKTALNWKVKQLAEGNKIRTRFDDESDASYDNDQQYFQIIQPYRARVTT